jgi:hypothetical protein
MPTNLSYPKPRAMQYKFFQVARADSSTHKCTLPKDAVVVDVTITQTAAAVTAAGGVDIGWAGNTDALIDGFSFPTTSVGMVKPGLTLGDSFNTRLDSDKAILSTYVTGSSTAGGTANVTIGYFILPPGETMFS